MFCCCEGELEDEKDNVIAVDFTSVCLAMGFKPFMMHFPTYSILLLMLVGIKIESFDREEKTCIIKPPNFNLKFSSQEAKKTSLIPDLRKTLPRALNASLPEQNKKTGKEKPKMPTLNAVMPRKLNA